MILDTNAVSAIVEGSRDIFRAIHPTTSHEIPLVVVGEYRFGLLGSDRKRHATSAFDHLLARSQVVYADLATT